MAAWDDSNDEQMVRLAISGDETAWTYLVEKYRLYGYRLAWRVTFNDDDALDAVQEMLVKMSTQLPTYKGTGSLRSWLATIVIREATNICRRRGKYPISIEPEHLTHAADHNSAHETHPGEALDFQRQLKQVHQAMSLLSPQQRAILLMALESDMTPAEIALELDLPANQVRSQQSRAINRLRHFVNPSSEPPPHENQSSTETKGDQDEKKQK